MERWVKFANVMPKPRELPKFSRPELRRILMRELRDPLQVRDKVVPLPIRLRRRIAVVKGIDLYAIMEK